MGHVGMKPQRILNVLQIFCGRTCLHRAYQRILIVSWVTAIILAGPIGSLPAAQDPILGPFSTAEAQGKPIPFFNEPFTAVTGLQTGNPRIAPALQSLIAQSAMEKGGGGRLPQMAVPDRIRVMFHLAEGTHLDPGGIASRGGRVLRHRMNLVVAEIPPDQIENLIQAEQGILFARLPHRFQPLGVTSEGVGLTNAGVFHSSGYRGAGVKVAVIDVGFKGLTEARNNGDLPVNVITRDFTGRSLETQYRHGTACAEIVHDMAPDAELHLLKVADEEDFYAAYDYCLDQSIHIISLSIGTFGSGPGDGTGPIDDFFNAARANGIFIVAAAGNGANFYSSGVQIGTHWKGTFTDSNQDTIHEFVPGVQGNILLALLDHDDDGNPEYNEVTIIMRWDDWPNARTDYDLHLYAYDYQNRIRGILVASSTGFQNGSQPPVEGIVADLPDHQTSRFYELVVVRKPDSPAGKELEIHAGGNSFFVGATPSAAPIATSAGSILEPADAAGVFAVGAINHTQWNFGPQEDFSSQGPTNAWAGSAARIKPDICGPDGVGSNTYGASFRGTSAAAPHVAGAAALLKSLHPNLLPGEMQAYLESWALDMGSPGKDNLYGWGRLRLLTHPLSTSKGGSGSGTISSTPSGINCGFSCLASYASGTNVTLTATADPGSTFAGWSGGGCSGTGQCTVTVDASTSVAAAFHQITYILSISKSGTGSGTVTSTPNGLNCGSICSSSYVTGTPVALTASPVFGSTFTGWTGGCSGTGQCTVIMDATKSAAATFALTTYGIASPTRANGTISCNPEVVNHGSHTACIITPDTGYHIVALSDNGAEATSAIVGNTYTINNVVSTHTIIPTFAINTYTITTSAGANGSIAPSSAVNHGSTATVAITPNPNYHVADVLVDGVSVGAVASYTFQNITASHTIRAAFAINTYSLALSKAGTGSGIVTSSPTGINCGNICSASYVIGASATLIATPFAGSTFTGWSGGGCTGFGDCSLILNGDLQITAWFANPWGDVNNDGRIDLIDAILSLQVLSNMNTLGRTIAIAADANGDSKIGLAELIYILQKVAGSR